jgi:hypothetical protein
MRKGPLSLWILCLTAQAHDPITTKLTWTHDVSRIVYARCASCHRPGGAAFSLLTYAEARPWARAISEEVLERRMPPWGAVKGFGEFRDDGALSLTELEIVAQWVDGGAPEGDPKDLPPGPKTGRRDAAPGKRRIPIDGDQTVQHTMTLEAILPETVPAGASMRIVAELPDGRVEPLVWLHRYDMKHGHAFVLRKPLRLPLGTVIRGVGPNARIALLGH